MALRRAEVVGDHWHRHGPQHSGRMQSAWGLSIAPPAIWLRGVRQAEVVVIATPVGQIPLVLQAMADHLAPGTLVTDGRQRFSVFGRQRDFASRGSVHRRTPHGRVGGGGTPPPIPTFRECFYVLTPTPEQEEHFSPGRLLSWSKPLGRGPSSWTLGNTIGSSPPLAICPTW